MVRAKKHFGQHFLIDQNIARKITDLLADDAENIIEVGAGTGVLTKYLLDKNISLTVVDIDPESIAYLQKNFPTENFSIIQGDFLKQHLARITKGRQTAVIGNFPYNISSQIVFKVIENREFIPCLVGMFQKEVAQRIVQREGDKTYGILSVLTQAFYEVCYIFSVPPNVFSPPPKVDSGVIKLIRKENYTLPVDEKLFFRIVKTAFNQRRKMLRSSLKSFKLSDALKQDTIFVKRPEQLSVTDFIGLTSKISKDEF